MALDKAPTQVRIPQMNAFCVANTNFVATFCRDGIYPFVHEIRSPVTWSSKPHMFAMPCLICVIGNPVVVYNLFLIPKLAELIFISNN